MAELMINLVNQKLILCPACIISQIVKDFQCRYHARMQAYAGDNALAANPDECKQETQNKQGNKGIYSNRIGKSE